MMTQYQSFLHAHGSRFGSVALLVVWMSLPGMPGPASAAIVTNVTLPAGYTLSESTFTNQVSITITNFTATNEALVLVMYHSANPERTNANQTGHPSTGHWGSATCQTTGLRPSGWAVPSTRPIKSVPMEPVPPGHENMDWITEQIAEMIRQHGIPKPTTPDELYRLGIMDKYGGVVRDNVGDSKLLYILNSTGDLLVQKECTCRYTGTHCYIYVDTNDWNQTVNGVTLDDSYVQEVGSFFDTNVWTQAESIYGTINNLRFGGMVYIVLSSYIGDNAYFWSGNEYPSVSGGNSLDSIYAGSFIVDGTNVDNAYDMGGTVGHEFSHLMRWYRKVYESGSTNYTDQQLIDQAYLDSPLNEGCAQMVEILVGRGFTNSERPPARYIRIYDMRNFLKNPELTPLFNVSGANRYAAGLFIVSYLYDHYGLAGLQRMSAADGKLALDAVAAAAVESNPEAVIDQWALALMLANYPGVSSNLTFTTLDLSGNTKYYNDLGLYPAYFYDSNIGNYTQGVDLVVATNHFDMANYTTYEWAPQFLRFFKGNSHPLTLSFENYIPNSEGAGSFTIYTVSSGPLFSPAITVHPVSQSVYPGEDVTFSVTATGTTPLYYQWQKDGTVLTDGDRFSGATTTSLVITAVQTEDAGDYWCVVSNLAGAATSSVATLTINTIPSVAPVTGDIDGDGLADLITVVDSNWYVWFSTAQYLVRGGPYALGISGTPATGDIDGDGKSDLISVVGSNWYVWFSTAQYLVRGGPYVLDISGTPVTGDIDGDGKSDLISVVGSNWYVWFSTAQYLVRGGPYVLDISGTPVTGDIDGDGKSDLISVVGSNWYVWFSTAQYLVRGGPYDLGVSGTPATGDIDGDGLADLISVVDSNWYVWFSTAQYLVRGGPYTLSAP